MHKSGGSLHTAELRPWELVAAIEFTKESSAVAFEKYLKSGSGRAFAKRHFGLNTFAIEQVGDPRLRNELSHVRGPLSRLRA